MFKRAIVAVSVFFGVACLAIADHPTGCLVPRDLAQRASRQNKKAAPIVQAILDGSKVPTLGPLPTQPEWDWTPTAGTPVQDQRSCGSCWDFGTCHCYAEAARAQTGVATCDPSEQDVLNHSGDGSCGGGYWAFDYFVKTGCATEADLPYVGYTTSKSAKSHPYKALTWGYVASDGGKPTDAQLKAALCKWGPIGVCVNADSALQNYNGTSIWVSPGRSTNHIVLVVGWSDTKKAWRVKNSWSSSWGDKGYFWCKMGSNIGDGAAYVVCQPKWVNDEEAEGLVAMSQSCDGCNTQQLKIDGPTNVACGSLVKLTAPSVVGARYTWSHVPDAMMDANSAVDTDKQVLYFAAPCSDGSFTFLLSLVQTDSDPVVLWHVLTVGSGPTPVPPGPGPGPGPTPPGPTPPPLPVLNEFGTAVRDWATSLVTAEIRANSAADLADNFAQVAADIDAGKITTVATAMAAVRAANSKDLDAAKRLAWGPWFDQLTARWAQAIDDGELSDTASMSAAGRQVAAGLRAAIPPKLQIEPKAAIPVPYESPALKYEAPPAVEKAVEKKADTKQSGHWESSGLFGRQQTWISDSPAGTSPAVPSSCPSGRCSR